MVAFAYMSRRRLVGRFMPHDLPARPLSRQAGTTLGPVLRRLFRLVVTAGVVGGVVVLVRKILTAGEPAGATVAAAVPPLPREEWPPLEPDPVLAEPPPSNGLEPDPEAPQPTETSTTGDVDAAWVDPVDDACPTTHLVKAKMASKIFHVPGGLSYERTKPDRCYRDAAAAEADGLRAAKR
jgi:hypothetical protein